MSSLKLNADSGGGSVALSGPSSTTSNAAIALKLPVADGSANQILKTDGSGQLGWATDNSGISLSGSTDNTIATVTGANALQGEANLTFDGTTLSVPDSITHIGDTDTKIRFNAANTFSVETAGQQNVQINGTRTLLTAPAGTDPVVRLHHQGNSGSGDITLDRTVNGFIINADTTNASSSTTYVAVKNGGTERFRITGTGSTLIGATSYGGGGVAPALYVSNSGGRQVKIHNTSDSTSSIQLTNSGTGEGDDNGLQIAVLSDSTVWFNNQESEPIRLAQGGSEKARFNADGTLCVSCTGGNVGRTDEGISLNADGAIVSTRDGCMHYFKSLATGGYSGIIVQSANTQVGSMTFNSGGTAWNTTSDYRLKENEVAISDGITRVKTLKPYRFNFKANPSKILDGFLAHEVTAVPEAITGTKDAVATEADATAGVEIGDPIYQQIDQSKLVPLLTAALQEAISKIETLETKVAVLEAA